MGHQEDYELRLDRERDQAIDFADDEFELELTLGDDKVAVFYVVNGNGDPAVTCASWGSGQADADCFSAWQIANWEMSIRRHLRAEFEQAECERRAA